MARPSPAGRALTRKERAEKRKQLTEMRAERGLGPLVLKSKEGMQEREFRGSARSFGRGIPKAEVFETDPRRGGKKRRIAVGAKAQKYF